VFVHELVGVAAAPAAVQQMGVEAGDGVGGDVLELAVADDRDDVVVGVVAVVAVRGGLDRDADGGEPLVEELTDGRGAVWSVPDFVDTGLGCQVG
jgi:hypothetical protein